jgi:hypothetical protein
VPRVGSFQGAVDIRVRASSRSRTIVTPDGIFHSAGHAAKVYGISRSLADMRAKKERFGWRYEAAPLPDLMAAD